MAEKPNSSNTKFNMTGEYVLVKNSSGIFFGKLERLDTREGMCLLSDAFEVSPKRHLTYIQAQRLIDSKSTRLVMKNSQSSGVAIANFNEVQSIASQNTITDYALEGIRPYHVATSVDEVEYKDGNSFFVTDEFSPLMSLMGLETIVLVNQSSSILEVNKDGFLGGPALIDAFMGGYNGGRTTASHDDSNEALIATHEGSNYYSEEYISIVAVKEGL